MAKTPEEFRASHNLANARHREKVKKAAAKGKKKRFTLPKNPVMPREQWGITSCKIMSEEALPNSNDILIRARCLQYHCFVIWDPARGILRSPWSHSDDRCEVIGWDRDCDTIVAVGAWVTNEATLFARKAETIALYSGKPYTPRRYARRDDSEEE